MFVELKEESDKVLIISLIMTALLQNVQAGKNRIAIKFNLLCPLDINML